ncbi:hypothetical protein BDR07DRAFT_1481746 [Suillus spraguei]|nr:hypothetical protein BDR07DRAFT_1481746 [Suillus spraguei]
MSLSLVPPSLALAPSQTVPLLIQYSTWISLWILSDWTQFSITSLCNINGIPCIVGGLTALLGMLNGRGGTFPWKTLPTILAHCGYILHHYPENVLMPGERRPTLARSKGIHNLTLCEWDPLTDALKANTITIEHVTTDKAHKTLPGFLLAEMSLEMVADFG